MQLSSSENGPPLGLKAIELIVSASFPVLEIVSTCGPLVCPGLIGPNARDCALMEIAGAETGCPAGGMVAKMG
jgi:hypothetical protein